MEAERGLVGAEEQCDVANALGCEGDLEPPQVDVMTFLEKAKFYTSLCLGTTAIVSVFAFLFLIPFVVDPAISTIIADYEQEPVTCIGVRHVYSEGLRNCTWSSCREGCTTAVLKCHQILVNYSKTPFKEFDEVATIDSVVWDINETKFFINTEGCGYPPKVNCSSFAEEYGKKIGVPFPCYYSKAYPEMVVARYSWDENLRHLVLSLLVPNILFGVSVGVLSYWYCPGCQRGCSKQSYAEKFPSKEDINEEEEEEFDEED